MSDGEEGGMNWGEVAVTVGICLAVVAGVLSIPQVRAYLTDNKPAA